jgi:hypothetical protein
MRIHLCFAFLQWVCPVASHAQERAAADAGVTIVSAAEASASQATLLLFNPAPGVLTLSFPGTSGPASMDLTATGVDPVSGAFTFATSADDAAALISMLGQLGCGVTDANLSTGLTLSGFINGLAVQLVVLDATQCAEGDGWLKAIMTFD